eukprot:TRINITY_DN6242_c0_g1_i1.p1 TRINITY_DN6242_c0_g1~~TRINITY_DN6242_c0_g1_i1.p1  ORF type:complete len:695 (+),score=98.20 TRINITY_DN6242_c0_g1_i1:96-2180(+)
MGPKGKTVILLTNIPSFPNMLGVSTLLVVVSLFFLQSAFRSEVYHDQTIFRVLSAFLLNASAALLCFGHKQSGSAGVLLSLLLFLLSFYSTGPENQPSSEFHRLFLFSMIVTLFVSTLIILWVWRKSQKRLGLFALLGFILFVSFFYSIHSVRSNWLHGLLPGSKLQLAHAGCSIDSVTPYHHIFPKRAMNFFTGSLECSGVPSSHRLTTFRQKDGLLTMNCPVTSLPARVEIRSDLYSFRRPHSLAQIFGTSDDQVTKPKIPESIVVPYKEPMKIESQYVRAFCGKDEAMFVRLGYNQTLHKTVRQNVVKNLTRKEKKSQKAPENVLVLLLDAVSRVQFYRALPKTAEFLRHLQRRSDLMSEFKRKPREEEEEEGYSVFEFLRYHGVGENSQPNLTPLLTGYNQTEIHLKTPSERADAFFWNRFRESNRYITSYVLAQCQNYFYKYWKIPMPEYEKYLQGTKTQGFAKVVGIDHDLMEPFCHPEYDDPDNFLMELFRGACSIAKRCIAGRNVHHYVFDYAREFLSSYQGVGKVSFFQLLEGHEASGEVLAVVDDALLAFLKDVLRPNRKDGDTVLFIVGDHGNHMTPFFYFTDAGRSENAMPIMLTIAPNSFLQRYPGFKENLRSKEQSLLTPYDLYATFLHLAKILPTKAKDSPEYHVTSRLPWAMSLLGGGSLKNRTCTDANIPAEFCTCK